MASLQLKATLEALPAIRAFVVGAAERSGLDRRAAYRLQLAVDEIATNIVVHGQADCGTAGSTIGVDAVSAGPQLTIIVEDDGPRFDPLTREAPSAEDLARPLDDRPMGGLGLFLAIRGVDEFRYERHGQINRNIFVVRVPAGPSA
jgi:anti-sigma regulatory factor (Ser/Thr protein kinase)